LRTSRATAKQPVTPPHFAASGCTTLNTPSVSAVAKLSRPAMFSPPAIGIETLLRSVRHSFQGRSARSGSSSQSRRNSSSLGASSSACPIDQP
jgi:hypothetical protein